MEAVRKLNTQVEATGNREGSTGMRGSRDSAPQRGDRLIPCLG